MMHERTPDSRSALIARAVSMAMATPLARLWADLVTTATAAVQNGIAPVQGQHFLQPDRYLPVSVGKPALRAAVIVLQSYRVHAFVRNDEETLRLPRA